jgi:hypothetical protein
MAIATGNSRALLIDSTNSTGNALNLTMYQVPNVQGTHGGQAYIQVVGCTVKNDNLTATINPLSRLLDPRTSPIRRLGPEAPHDDHAWDDFGWEDRSDSSAERQFLLAFTPSSPAYNNTATDPPTTPIGDPESVLAKLLDGRLFTPFSTSANNLVNFQGALEQLYASYLWNVNRLCPPLDQIQPYWELCGRYAEDTDSFAEFVLSFPGSELIVVRWRAIVSLLLLTAGPGGNRCATCDWAVGYCEDFQQRIEGPGGGRGGNDKSFEVGQESGEGPFGGCFDETFDVGPLLLSVVHCH